MTRVGFISLFQIRSMRFPALGSALVLLFLSSGVSAQIPDGMEGAFEPHPEGQEAISRLYSPFCPGFMLEVCTASQSAVLRDSIHALAYEGWTSDQLVDWMISNYGEEYRAVPETRGLGVFAWLLPPLALLLGVGLVVTAIRRFSPVREAAAGTGQGQPLETIISSEEQAQLRSAIREIELSEDPSF